MDKLESAMGFNLMALYYKLRDARTPPQDILEEAGIKQGAVLLDYGCGPGSFVAPAAKLVGETGWVYALDINPLAIKSVRRIIAKYQLGNVETIQSGCRTGLADVSIDVALLYDIFHGLSEPGSVLAEIYRVLKPAGVLSFSDHHLVEDEIISVVTGSGLFRLSGKGAKTYSFLKSGSAKSV